jgi:predicted nucleic acid-binding protein
MQNLALDTNAYTAFGRGNKTLYTLIASVIHIGLPITVLGEIQFGILNGSQGETNSVLLERFLSNTRVEILDINDTTAKLYGEIATELRRSGRPIQQNDIWMAALCKQYGYRLATKDTGFSNITGLELVNF